MSRRPHIVALLACLFCGLAAGWLLHGGPPEEPKPVGPASKSERRSKRDARPAPPAGITSRVGRVADLDDLSDRMKGAYAMAMAMPLEHIEEWLQGDYFDTPDSRVDGFFYQVLHNRWLDADPEAFLTRAIHKNYDSVLINRYMKEWARRDVDAARDFMMDLQDRRDFQRVASHVMAEMAKTRPGETVMLISELLQSRNIESHGLKEAIKTLTANDLDGMLATARDWPPELETLVMQQAADTKLQTDFLGAVRWLQDQRGTAAQQLVNEAISNNPKLAQEFLQVARHLPEGWADTIIEQESWSLSQADPEGILALQPEDLGLRDGRLNNVRIQALQQLVDRDWDRAETMLLNSPDLSEKDRQNLAAQLARHLATKDAEQAAAWASALTNPGQRQSAEEAAKPQESGSRSLHTLTPESLVAAALAESSSMSFYPARRWPRSMALEAVDAFHALDPERRAKATKRLLSNHHYLPFELQAAVVDNQLKTPAPQLEEHQSPSSLPVANQAQAVARSWASWEPAAAARWVESLPAGSARDQATEAVLRSWRLHAPGEADRWAERQASE